MSDSGRSSNILALFFKFSIGSWFSAALSFFTTPIITALILPEEFGKASMFTLAYNFIVQIVLLGTDQSFVRRFYNDEFKVSKQRLLFNSVLLPLALSLVMFIPLILFWKRISNMLIDDQDFKIVLMLGCIIVAGVFERYALLLLRMQKKASTFSLLKIIGSIVSFGSLIIYAKFIENNFYAVIISTLMPLIVTALIGIALEFDEWFKNLQLDKKLLTSLVKYGFPFLPTFLISWVFEGIDKIALRQYSTFTEIGLFTAAFKIVALLSILQAAFSTFWTPIAYEVYELKSEKANELFAKSFAYISGILFICGIGIFLFKEVISVVFASNYREAIHIMPFLLFIPIMYTLSEITVGGINFMNKTYWHMVIAGICALTNFGLNIFFVPELGAKGAALATGVSYIIFFYARTIISNKVFPIDFGMKRLTFSIALFFIAASINTFVDSFMVSIISNSIILIVTILLYANEIVFFIKLLKEKYLMVGTKQVAE